MNPNDEKHKDIEWSRILAGPECDIDPALLEEFKKILEEWQKEVPE